MPAIYKLLTTNYKLPPFKQYRKAMIISLLFVLLPNVFFWFIAWYKGLARPLINLDYLLPLVLLVAPISYKIGKIIGGFLLLIAILSDFVMLAMQISRYCRDSFLIAFFIHSIISRDYFGLYSSLVCVYFSIYFE